MFGFHNKSYNLYLFTIDTFNLGGLQYQLEYICPKLNLLSFIFGRLVLKSDIYKGSWPNTMPREPLRVGKVSLQPPNLEADTEGHP